MRVFIGNFGRSNWAWSDCLKSKTLVVMDDYRLHPFWQQGDKAGYIKAAKQFIKSSSGNVVIDAVASKWYNCNTLLFETAGEEKSCTP